jgi:hypothetical protein
MNEYDLIIKALENIIESNIRCEDNEIYLSHAIKYELFALLYEIDKKFIEKLFKKIEYKENNNE